MEYSAELFTTDRFFSDDTQYNYEISGAFYDVYSDGEGDYHMAIEDKASLEARIWFYDHFITKETNYPIYDNRRGVIREQQVQNLLLLQVLGLPEEVIKAKDSQGKLTINLTPDEILRRIHFESGLFKGYGKTEVNYNILGTNNYAVIGCVNDLIANGFFVQNPERIYRLDSLDDANYYPVYIDENRIPKKYLLTPETADKLIFDFVDQPQQISRDDFIKYFKPIDTMSLSEKAEIAFSRNYRDNSPVSVKLRIALRRYFYAIIREIMNHFFFRMYRVRALFGHTVIYHDFHAYELQQRFVYLGLNFNMFSFEHRDIIEENGKYVERFDTDYRFCEADKKGLALAYDLVHQYFTRHEELAFVPSLFMKMMGLPYPAYEKAKFFDFKNGDSKSFLKLFDYDFMDQYSSSGLILPGAVDFGTLLPEKTWKTYIPFYLKQMQKHKVFFTDPSILYINPCDILTEFDSLETKEMGFSFMFGTAAGCHEFKDMRAGKINVYLKSLDALEKAVTDADAEIEPIEQIRSFLLRDEVNGVVPTMVRYLELLNQGYRSDEAYRLVEPDVQMPYGALIALVLETIVLTHQLKSLNLAKTIKYNRINLVFWTGQNLGFVDKFLPKPFVFRGRNFLAYMAYGDKDCYFDTKDKKAIENLLEIYDKYFKRKEYFSYVFHFNHDEIRDMVPKYEGWTDLLDFLGLPKAVSNMLDSSKPILEQLSFKPGISIFRQDHFEMIEKDLALRNLYLNREALRRGVYPLGSLNQARPMYLLKDKIDSDVRFYFDPVVIKTIFFAKHNEGQLLGFGREVDKLLELPIDKFAKKIEPYLWKAKEMNNTEGIAALVNQYTGSVNHAFASILRQRTFPKEEKFYNYLVSYRLDDGTYVAPGPSFFAYSKTGKINDFALEAKDIPLVVKAINTSMSLYFFPNEVEKGIMVAAECGLPLVFAKKIVALVKKKPYGVTKRDIMNTLPIVETASSMKENLSFSDYFEVKKTSFHHMFTSTQLYHTLLEEGMFVYPGTRYLHPALTDTQKLADSLKGSYYQVMIEHTYIFLKDMKGTVKSILEPDEIAFTYTLDSFIKQYDKTGLSSEFLFYTKEALLYARSKDPAFLVKAINTLQGVVKFGAFNQFLDKLYDGFSLKPYSDHISQDAFSSFFTLFILYLEQQIIYLVSKKYRKHST